MATTIKDSCTICYESFSLGRPDLELPCKSHRICKACVALLEIKKDKKCPICRFQWTKSIIDKPYLKIVKIAFIEHPGSTSSSLEGREEAETCQDHKICTVFWCLDCKDLLCFECVVSSHWNHKFRSAVKSFYDIKESLQRKIDNALCTVKKRLNLQMVEFEEACERTNMLVSLVSLMNQKISENVPQLSLMSETVIKLTEAQSRVNKFKDEVQVMNFTQQYVYVKESKALIEDVKNLPNVAGPDLDTSSILLCLLVSIMLVC